MDFYLFLFVCLFIYLFVCRLVLLFFSADKNKLRLNAIIFQQIKWKILLNHGTGKMIRNSEN